MYSGSQLIKAIRDIAEKNPQGRYERCGEVSNCFYARGTLKCVENRKLPPGCIVGLGLLAIGVPVAELEAVDRDSFDLDAGEACDKLGVRLTRLQAEWLGSIQGRQDSGYTWSYAVEFADKWLLESALGDNLTL